MTHQSGACFGSCAPSLSRVDRLRIEGGARHLHKLGPRPLAEFLIEIAAATSGKDAVFAALEDFRRLTPEMVRAVGGDRFPSRALHEVPK